MSNDKEQVEEIEEELDEGLLDGADNEGKTPDKETLEKPELTLDGLASGVQNAINGIIQGTTQEFDRINSELDKLKRYDGALEARVDEALKQMKEYSALNRKRLLKIEKEFKALVHKKK